MKLIGTVLLTSSVALAASESSNRELGLKHKLHHKWRPAWRPTNYITRLRSGVKHNHKGVRKYKHRHLDTKEAKPSKNDIITIRAKKNIDAPKKGDAEEVAITELLALPADDFTTEHDELADLAALPAKLGKALKDSVSKAFPNADIDGTTNKVKDQMSHLVSDLKDKTSDAVTQAKIGLDKTQKLAGEVAAKSSALAKAAAKTAKKNASEQTAKAKVAASGGADVASENIHIMLEKLKDQANKAKAAVNEAAESVNKQSKVAAKTAASSLNSWADKRNLLEQPHVNAITASSIGAGVIALAALGFAAKRFQLNNDLESPAGSASNELEDFRNVAPGTFDQA